MNKAIKYLMLLLVLANGHFPATAQAQPVENLVFEGAGIRGIAYSGAITELERNQVLPQVKRVGGTSAGAITALMLSLGYNAAEITGVVGNTNFKKFNDGHLFFAGGLARLTKTFGWYRGGKAERWLAEIIKTKTGNENTTFGELKQKGFKDLYVTGTSLTRQQLIVFSYESFPNMRVKDAVRISMSIPFYFEAVFMDSTGRLINRPQNKQGLDVLVDGGFTGNFPIRLFDSTKYFAPGTTNKFAFNPCTLGFRIDSDAQIANDSNSKGLTPLPINNLKQYTVAFYIMLIENLNRQTLTTEDWHRTVSISDGGISPRIRRLSTAEVERLVKNGSKGMVQYLNR